MSDDEELLKKLNISKKRSTLIFLLKIIVVFSIIIFALSTQILIIELFSIFLSFLIIFSSWSKPLRKHEESLVDNEIEIMRNTVSSILGGLI